MSIDAALNSALSGLKASQKSLAVISSNIANANTEGYARRVVNQSVLTVEGEGVGTFIDGVARVVDSFAIEEIRSQNSSVGYAKTQNDYYQDIQRFLGNPDANNSLSTRVDEFFASIQALSNNVELPSLRTTAVNSLNALTEALSGTAAGLEEVRARADGEIASAVDFLNQQIDQIYDLNNAIREGRIRNAPTDALEEERDNILNQMAKYINLSVVQKEDGRIIINTGNGVPLLDDGRYHLQYNRATSADTFSGSEALNPITVIGIDGDGHEYGAPSILATGGVRDEITSSLRDGKLKALLDIRDNQIPSILDQLDQMARQLTDSVNAIHNQGVGFPPAGELTGTTALSGTEVLSFSGSVRFAVLDENGQPISSPYPDLPYYPPLTMDLESMSSATTGGEFNVSTFINEFNSHFQVPPTRVDIGNMFNIRLAATSSVVAPLGNFSFNFELENYSGAQASFEVLAVSVSGGGSVNSGVPSSSEFYVNPGDKVRSDSAHSLSLTMGAGSGPYSIDITVKVSDGNGGFVTDTIRYTINQETGILNKRFSPTTVIAPTSAQIIPGSSQELARAVFVNEKGEEIDPKGYEKGYLKIIANTNGYSIAIDEMTSQQLGWVNDPSKVGTDRGFSHFFGLNNVLVTEEGVKNAAYSLHIREDIATNSNLLALGMLTRSSQSSNPDDAPVFSYEVASGSNANAKALAGLEGNSLYFDATDTLASGGRTLGSYSIEILAFTATRSSFISTNLTQESLIMEGFTQKFEATSGVNIDEELSKTIFFQNAYTASARVITVSGKLFDVLMGIV